MRKMLSRWVLALAMAGALTAVPAGSTHTYAPEKSAKMSKRTFKHPPRAHPREQRAPAVTQDELEDLRSLPKHFDWCEKGFCGPSWNQHIPQYCGSCYLHGSLSAYQDRALIEGVAVTLSRQTFLNCAPGRNYTNGCNGGEPAEVYGYMKEYGLPDESCLPYNATDNTKYGDETSECPAVGECMNCMYIQGTQKTDCWPVKTFTRYRAKKWGRVVGEAAMMKEIYKRGPITCGISCPDGFTYDYRSGIFEDKTNNRDVDHDIEVVGWGEEDGVKYWHVRTSWGTYWGMNGFFKVVRGVDNIAIESDCWWVEPDLSDFKLVAGSHPRYGGSQYGVVDMKADTNVEEMARLSAADTKANTQQLEVAMLKSTQSSQSFAVNGVFVLAILALAFTLFSARHRLRRAMRGRVIEYSPII